MGQNNQQSTNKLSYKDAGVDIVAGNQLVENIKPIVKRTHGPEVLTGIGGFASFFDLGQLNYKHPVLVSATDGVGTKLKLTIETNQHESVGIDLVAMCVNDLLCTGAKPLFFLDYYASSALDVKVATKVVAGIAKGCELSGCSLVGGETAEMPGLYQPRDYDLAGFAVGIVEKDAIISPEKVQSGNVLIGLLSNGVHSNGYSLVRKVLEQSTLSLASPFGNGTLQDELLKPTQIYVKPVLSLLEKVSVNALSHITGGGILENLPRVLPESTKAIVYKDKIPSQPVFEWLIKEAKLNQHDAYTTFNCGVGMILAVNPDEVDTTLRHLHQENVGAVVIGEVAKSDNQKPYVELL